MRTESEILKLLGVPSHLSTEQQNERAEACYDACEKGKAKGKGGDGQLAWDEFVAFFDELATIAAGETTSATSASSVTKSATAAAATTVASEGTSAAQESRDISDGEEEEDKGEGKQEGRPFLAPSAPARPLCTSTCQKNVTSTRV